MCTFGVMERKVNAQNGPTCAKWFALGVLATMLALFAGCGPSGPSPEEALAQAVAYNDTLVAQQHRVMIHVTRFAAMLEGGDSAALDSTRLLAVQAVDSALGFIQVLPRPDTAQAYVNLQNAALRQLTFYRKVLNDEYRQMMALHLKQPVTEADQRAAQVLIESIAAQEATINNAYRAAQEALAARYGTGVEAPEGE